MRGPACPCLDALAPADLFERTFLGTDELYGDARIDLCRTCGRRWLHYHLTYEGFADSGRWFRGQAAPETALSPRNAALVFGDLPGYFAGGLFFGGQAHRRSGPAETREAPHAGPAFRILPWAGLAPLPPRLPETLRDFARRHDDGDPQFEPHVAPSPEGSRWAFTTRSVEKGVTSVWVDGDLLTEIPGTAVHPCPFWSPHGRTLGLHVVHLEQGRSAVVLLPDLKGEGEILYQNELLEAAEAGAWSPSGRSIAIMRAREPRHEFTRAGEPEVAILDAASGEFFPLCEPGEARGRPHWVDQRTLEVGGGPSGRRFEFSIPV